MKLIDLRHDSFLKRREKGVCQEKNIDEYILTLSGGK